MDAKIKAARWLTYRTAFLLDHDAKDWEIESARTKLFVVPAMTEVVEISKRIHGAYGYVKGNKIERLYRAIAGFSAIAVSLEINKSVTAQAILAKR